MNEPVLKIFGAVEKKVELGFEDLERLPAEFQIPDVSAFVTDREGRAVWVRALLDLSRPKPDASHITFRSKEGFVSSVPLNLVDEKGLVLYKTRQGTPLPASLGGPFRLFVPGSGTTCDNVKSLSQIEITAHQAEGTVPRGEPEVKKFVRVARLDEIPLGGAKVIENHEKPIALFRTQEGFFAVNHVCPHRGGPLGEGTVCGRFVTCPWHGWSFDVQTGLSAREGGHTIGTYEVRIDGNNVLVGWLKKTA